MLKNWLLKTFEIKIKLKGIYLLMFIVLLACSIFAYKSIQYNNAYIVVPELVGMTISEAEIQLDAKGIKYNIREVETTIESGIVIGQSPAYGLKMRKDEKIKIDVSKNKK